MLSACEMSTRFQLINAILGLTDPLLKEGRHCNIHVVCDYNGPHMHHEKVVAVMQRAIVVRIFIVLFLIQIIYH